MDHPELQAEVARRRTFAIISHPDAGKTTLTEKLLLYGGAIRQAGSVKARKAARHATSEAWFDTDGEPLTMGDTYVRVEREFDDRGNVAVMRTCSVSLLLLESIFPLGSVTTTMKSLFPLMSATWSSVTVSMPFLARLPFHL